MKQTLLILPILLLTGCTSTSIYETRPSVYQLSKSSEQVHLGSELKERLMRQGKEFCRKKGGELILEAQHTSNRIENYQPSTALIEFSCEFSFQSDRRYEITGNEVFSARNKYNQCLRKTISQVYTKEIDHNVIAKLAQRICMPDMKIWRYAKGYNNGQNREEIELDIREQEHNLSASYEAILEYQRDIVLKGTAP